MPKKPKSLNILPEDRIVGMQAREKRDLLAGCNEPGKPWFNRNDHEFIRMRRSDMPESPGHSLTQILPRFCARYDIPTLLLLHLQVQRVVLVHFDSEDATLPVAQVNLPQVGQCSWGQVQVI